MLTNFEAGSLAAFQQFRKQLVAEREMFESGDKPVFDKVLEFLDQAIAFLEAFKEE